MSEHDFSGIDERKDRWLGPTAGILFFIGSLFAFVLIVAVAGKFLED